MSTLRLQVGTIAQSPRSIPKIEPPIQDSTKAPFGGCTFWILPGGLERAYSSPSGSIRVDCALASAPLRKIDTQVPISYLDALWI